MPVCWFRNAEVWTLAHIVRPVTVTEVRALIIAGKWASRRFAGVMVPLGPESCSGVFDGLFIGRRFERTLILSAWFQFI